MEDLLGRCEWPPLPAKYEKALRECVEFLFGRFEVTAIVAAGTIVRGNPDPLSDFDVYVVHRADFKQRLQRFFNGVPTEMFVNSLPQVYRNLDLGLAERRPDTAHMLATGFPVLDLVGEIGPLKERAIDVLKRSPEASEEVLTRERYRPATLFEDALDVRDRDPETAELILGEAVPAMLMHAFSRAGRFFPRKKDLLETLAAIDPGTATLARRFYSARELSERLELAGQIADRTIRTRGFFEWESEPIVTEP